MIIFIASILFFSLAICGLAIGVIISDKRIKGSCGGLNTITNDEGDKICGLCNHPVHDCQKPEDESKKTKAR